MGRKVGYRKKVRNDREAFRDGGRERERKRNKREREKNKQTDTPRKERIAKLRAVHVQCGFLFL